MKTATFARNAFGTVMALFLTGPLIVILPLAFTSSVFLNYPISQFSLRWFEELYEKEAWHSAIVNSMIIGTGTGILAGILGTLAALGIRHMWPVFSSAFRTAFLLPMVVPTVVLGVGLQLIFQRLGIANSFLGVIIAHTVVAVPFVIVTVSASLAGVDHRIEMAAASLGASPIGVLRFVTLPLTFPGIISGFVLAFATSLDEVVLTLFVAGPNQRTLARQMFASIRENISPAIAAAAFIFLLLTFIIAVILALGRRYSSGTRQAE